MAAFMVLALRFMLVRCLCSCDVVSAVAGYWESEGSLTALHLGSNALGAVILKWCALADVHGQALPKDWA